MSTETTTISFCELLVILFYLTKDKERLNKGGKHAKNNKNDISISNDKQ